MHRKMFHLSRVNKRTMLLYFNAYVSNQQFYNYRNPILIQAA